MLEHAVQLGDFEKRLTKRARSARQPMTCIFELTPTCNLRCHFCYVALDPYKGPYLSTEQILQVLDTLRDAGVLWLVLTGGEVLTRRDFPEIYRGARERGFLVTVFTNATMMTEQAARMFRDDPPFLVEVSLYGADAERYEGTTGIKGSFARFERGIEWLQWAGVPLIMKTAMSTLTEDHLGAMKDWCDSRGLPYKVDRTVDARHDGGQEPTMFRIAPRKVKEVGDEVARLFDFPVSAATGIVPGGASENQLSGLLPECSVAPEDGNAGEELYNCGAGRVAFFIDGLGQASHCVIDRKPSFPILEMPWKDLWQQMGEWVTQPLPEAAACSGCELRSSCNNCPARSMLATGSPYEKDTYYCDITHIEHGLEPADHSLAARPARPLGACAV